MERHTRVESAELSLGEKLRLALWKKSPADAFDILKQIDQILFPGGSELGTFREAPDMAEETIGSIGGAMDTAYHRLPVNFPFVLSDMTSHINLVGQGKRTRLEARLVTQNEDVKKAWENLNS